MKIYLISKSLIEFLLFRLYSFFLIYFHRFIFLFEKKQISIQISEILKLSLSNINALRKINNNKYETKILRFLKKKSINKKYFFDIGAHYGFYSLNLNKLFDKLYLFEANPLNLKILKHNISKLKEKNFHITNAFVGKDINKINFLMSNFSFISQFDKRSFLTDELNEFCEVGFFYNKKIDLNKIKKNCYNKMINKKFFFCFISLFFNLFQNHKKISFKNLKDRLALAKRYNFYYDRYICKKIKILSKPLDDMFKGSFPKSLIKIDVEGAEIDVILGMKKFVKANKPDIFCEIGHDQENIIRLIVKMGYKYKCLDWKSYYFEPKKFI